jgi:hypothetical protein
MAEQRQTAGVDIYVYSDPFAFAADTRNVRSVRKAALERCQPVGRGFTPTLPCNKPYHNG